MKRGKPLKRSSQLARSELTADVEKVREFLRRSRAASRPRARSARFRSGQLRCVHPACDHSVARAHEHHVVYEQHVRREHGDPDDPRNALRLCVACHASHHSRGRVVPLVALRDANYAFAFELLGAAAFDYLRRRYSGDDPRLHEWLRRVETAAVSSGDRPEEVRRAEG